MIGPVVMTVAGDSYIEPATISVVIWHGAGTAADTVQIYGRGGSNGTLLWSATAPVDNYYVSETFRTGISAPEGFRLAQVSSGTLLVYIEEPSL